MTVDKGHGSALFDMVEVDFGTTERVACAAVRVRLHETPRARLNNVPAVS